MKKTFVLLAILMLTATVVYAATDSGNISVTATLAAGTPDANFRVYKAPGGGNIDFGTEFPSMNFNSWTTVQKPTKAAQWTSVDHYAVVAYANGMGRQYYIKSLATGSFVSGANTLPAGSFACIPVYAAEDEWSPGVQQGAKPGNATLANMFAAINATAQTVYTSENPSTPRIIQVRYGFVPYTNTGANPYTGYAPIPTSQVAGTYTGVTVKVSITQ